MNLLYLLPLLTPLALARSTPNKLPTLGPPNLVPKLPDGTGGFDPTQDNPKFNAYPTWTTSPCDLSHPYTAVENRAWQELELPGPDQCVELGKWSPYGDSGYTLRVEDFSVMPSADESPCQLMLFTKGGCEGGRSVETIDTSVIDTESRCWSTDARMVAKSAMMHCSWANLPE